MRKLSQLGGAAFKSSQLGGAAKRALPEEDGIDDEDVRAPRYTPHKNTP